MNALNSHAEDYLRLRRALGFKLERAGQLLPQLAAYLEATGAGTVTSDLAIAWARLPDATPNHWAQRLAIAGQREGANGGQQIGIGELAPLQKNYSRHFPTSR